MGESLYAVLGVSSSANAGTIEQAFREHAKTHHPDVSDAPDARRRFKRLTVARDTLLDPAERARYDELGHESYIRQHAQAELFDVGGDGADESAGATGNGTGTRTVADGYGEPDEWWTDRGSSQSTGDQSSSTTTSQPHQEEPAAEWARTRDRTSEAATGPESRVRNFIQNCGIWLVFHLLLLVSAVSTGWFIYTLGAGAGLALPAILLVVLVVTFTTAGSTLHVVSLMYT